MLSLQSNEIKMVRDIGEGYTFYKWFDIWGMRDGMGKFKKGCEFVVLISVVVLGEVLELSFMQYGPTPHIERHVKSVPKMMNTPAWNVISSVLRSQMEFYTVNPAGFSAGISKLTRLHFKEVCSSFSGHSLLIFLCKVWDHTAPGVRMY